MDHTDEIVHDFTPYFLVFKDGRVERLQQTDIVPPSLDLQGGVSSKDVQILPNVSARLYLPKLHTTHPKLPILVYYHGGGFCFCTAFCNHYHRYLNLLVAEANVVAVSVEYRKAPEHPLPAGYDDSWAALRWVASHSAGGPEPWLSDYGDFDRITLAGDSAGGNIVHNIAMRAGRDELGHGVKIRGSILVHPFFTGSEAIGSEIVYPERKVMADRIWRFACPTSVGLDDPLINPMAVGAPSLSGMGGSQVMVCVAEKDVSLSRDRLWAYYERLRSSGWKGVVEMFESEGEDHVFHLFNPDCENAGILMKRFVSFLN